MNILCTDKTGTLTENFAQLNSVFDYRKRDRLLGLGLAYLNSAYQEAFRNLTDQAIIQAYDEKVKAAKQFDADELTINKIKEIPFDFSRRKVTVVYEVPEHGLRVLITKGAVNEMLEVCTHCTDQSAELKETDVLSLADLFRVLKQINRPTDQREASVRSDQNDEPVKNLTSESKGESTDELKGESKSELKRESLSDLKSESKGKPIGGPVGDQKNELNLQLKPMTPEIVARLRQYNDQLNQDGYRVLAVAFQVEHMTENSSDRLNEPASSAVHETTSLLADDKQLDDEKNRPLTDDLLRQAPNEKMAEKELIFVCYLTFLNPPKTSAAKAINDLIQNNVKVKVLTGDTKEVCKNVCKQIGLSTSSIITSKELNQLSEDELKEVAIGTVIFSQLTPIQKFNIVRVLKKHGHVVGFLG